MARTIAPRDLRNHTAEIIDGVRAGDSFIVTRHGEPIAELRPIVRRRRRVVARSDLIDAFTNGVRLDAQRFGARPPWIRESAGGPTLASMVTWIAVPSRLSSP